MSNNIDNNEKLVEEECPYYECGDLWMCKFCEDNCSLAEKDFEEDEEDEGKVIIHDKSRRSI